MEIDELKWSQRAKENWLKHGDKNSKYFHACVKQRRTTNQITEVRDTEGIVCSTSKAVEKAFPSYFQNLFTSDSPRGIFDCLHGLPSNVTREMNNQLVQRFIAEEVSSALSHMAPLKALGLRVFTKKIRQILARTYAQQQLIFFTTS